MTLLAHRLGTTAHRSLLLAKAARLGLVSENQFMELAFQRGCFYYAPPEFVMSRTENVTAELTDEELAIALMHPSLPWNPQRLRVAAAMVGSANVDVSRLARLAVQERCVSVLRYIAEAGSQCEPWNAYWKNLLMLLPATKPLAEGTLPHPTRFMALTGKQSPFRPPQPAAVWIRPRSQNE